MTDSSLGKVIAIGTFEIIVEESEGDRIPHVIVSCVTCNERIAETHGFSRASGTMDTHWVEKHSPSGGPQIKTEAFA